jgi:putative iron-regulated protein
MTRLMPRIFALATVVGLTATACGDDSNVSVPSAAGDAVSTTVPGAPAGASEQDFLDVASTYSKVVYASYQASIESATVLAKAVETFVGSPTDDTLAAAKQAWLTARDDYGPTEAFRLYDGPIDDPENGPEGRINAWPMDEAYVDYVKDDPDAGIINNRGAFPEITTAVVVAANENGGETNISTGWHAIEFLLWGQDLSAQGPGSRPLTDYTTDVNAARRATYLSLLTDLLLEDLKMVTQQWAPETGTYRKTFLDDPGLAVQRVMRGIGALSAGELAGERMAVAFETKDQEDEHSCFSDNTNADVRNNARGIRMVYLADFPGVEGKSPSELVAIVDPGIDEQLRAQLDRSIALAEAFPATFEAMIAAPEGDPLNAAFAQTMVSIEKQGELIALAAGKLGLEISITV